MASEPPENISETLLNRAHSSENAETIFRERVRQRPLVLRPTSPDPALNARSKRQHERLKKQNVQRKSNKPKPLSAKRKRALCVYDIPKAQQKYAIYEPLHAMWCAYMREILGIKENGSKKFIDAQGAGPMLVTADYHGALVEVVRSRCVSRVGLRGIVVKDTKFSFEIVTMKDELKIVPKEHTVFRMEVPWEEGKQEETSGGQKEKKKPFTFEIHGSQFEVRAPERASKKFKMHLPSDL